jgi:hypothetical protein
VSIYKSTTAKVSERDDICNTSPTIVPPVSMNVVRGANAGGNGEKDVMEIERKVKLEFPDPLPNSTTS